MPHSNESGKKPDPAASTGEQPTLLWVNADEMPKDIVRLKPGQSIKDLPEHERTLAYRHMLRNHNPRNPTLH